MIPNIITGFRILMIFPILTCVAKGQNDPQMFRVAALLFLIAITTDMLDGQAARRLNQASVFGSMFDLTADRLLMTPTLLLMAHRGAFEHVKFLGSPTVYLVLIVFADLTVLSGVYMFSKLYKKDKTVEVPTPPFIAKAAYPVQGSVVFLALLLSATKPMVVSIFMYASAFMTIAAFVVYMAKGSYVFKKGLPAAIEAAVNEFTEDVPRTTSETPPSGQNNPGDNK